jgi:nucleoside phosphorylase
MELKDIKGKIDYAIITMKKEEFEAVLDRFPGKNVLGGNRNYRISEIQTINDQKYLVAVTRCNAQANLESLSITKDIISDLDPQQILLVGIAGAVPKPDLTLGD